MIIHRCSACGMLKANRCAGDDDGKAPAEPTARLRYAEV